MNSIELTLHTLRALDRNPRDAREDRDPANDTPDTRRRWTDLDEDQRRDEAVDYMREYTVRNGAARASLLWAEALSQTKTTKGMIDYLGRVMIRNKSEYWCW